MGPALVAGLFMLGHLVLSHFFTGRRNQLNLDAELYHQLPPGSSARAALLESIEERTQTYVGPRKWLAVVTAPSTYFVLNLMMVLAVVGLLTYSAFEVHTEQQERTSSVEQLRGMAEEAAEQARTNQEMLEGFLEGMRSAEEMRPN